MNENNAVYEITTMVSVNGIALKPNNPNVERIIPKIISAIIRNSNVLLGAECQKCFFSRTTNMENNAKKSSISKQKVLSALLSALKLKYFKPI